MAVNPTIYNNVQPVPSPFATMEEVARAKNAQLVQQLNQFKIQDEQEKRAQKQKDEQSKAMLNAAIGHALNPDGSINRELFTKEITASGFSDPAGALLGLDELESSSAKAAKAMNDKTLSDVDLDKAHGEVAGSLGRQMQYLADHGASPEDVAGVGLAGMARFKKLGLVPDDEAVQIINQMDPSNPEALKGVIGKLIGANPPAEAKPEAGFTLSPGQTRYDSQGKPVATAEGKPANAANVGSFEDYVLRTYGENPTPQQVLAARKAYQQADDRPSVTVHTQNGMTPNAEFNATRQLRNDYGRETKSYNTVAGQLAQMKDSLESVKHGEAAAGSQGVLVTFQKILDPTSVVRESEYARSSAGLSLLGQLEGRWERIRNGGAGVRVEDLEQFVNLAEKFTKDQKAFADSSRAQVNEIAKKYGIDPNLVTRDLPSPGGEPPPADKPATAAQKMKIGRFDVEVEP